MRWLLIACVVLVALRTPAQATVLGGGLADTDCTIAFEGVTATDGESGVVCVDGDPACDADGAADGTCRFTVSVCTRVVANACTPRDVSSLAMAGFALDPPPLESGPTCGATADETVAAGDAIGATIVARDGAALKDVDYLNLCCTSARAPFDAVRCALAVDPAVAGCSAAVPPAFVSSLQKARTLIDQAASHPAEARSAGKRAAKPLRRMRAIAQRFQKSDPCGYVLGLMTSHARAVLHAARR